MTAYQVRVFTKPVTFNGTITRGFGRGSRELGIATANLDDSNAGKVAAHIQDALRITEAADVSNGGSEQSISNGNDTHNISDVSKSTGYSHDVTECSGVYYGVGRIGSGTIYRAAISVGRNPHYGNINCTCETHLIDYVLPDGDSVYDMPIRCAIIGKLRDQRAFDSLESLRRAINDDIECCRTLVDQQKIDEYGCMDFLKVD